MKIKMKGKKKSTEKSKQLKQVQLSRVRACSNSFKDRTTSQRYFQAHHTTADTEGTPNVCSIIKQQNISPVKEVNQTQFTVNA